MNLNGKIAELVGAIIGDGNLWSDGRHYRVELTGNPNLDVEYFRYLSEIISSELGENPRSKIRQRGLRIRVCSKELFDYFSEYLGIPVSSGKAKKVKIPKKVVEASWGIKCKCIRGIADSDGSFFFSDK